MAQVTLTPSAAMKALSMCIPNWGGMPIPSLLWCATLVHVTQKSKAVLMIYIGDDEML